MPINKETIISVFDEKLTLMQWLKTINKALEDAVLTGVEVRQKGNATYSFVVTFEDGTELESNEFVLAQGESINGATIRNGHLYLSLTNGDELDAGNLKPVTSFTINESQHLIVNYGDGTSQDLGAIFSGNVNIDGTLDATKVTGNEIVEKMTGYRWTQGTPANVSLSKVYVGAVKNGNKLTLVVSYKLTSTNTNPFVHLGGFAVPSNVGNKIFPVQIGSSLIVASNKVSLLGNSYSDIIEELYFIGQNSLTSLDFYLSFPNSLTIDKEYYVRIESTILLSDTL